MSEAPDACCNTPASGSGELLKVRGLSKWFGSVCANDGIDVTFEPLQVHGLLGENGAGKSTLVKILTGIHQPDEGSIEAAGRPVAIGSPIEARSLGIAAVHQTSTLVPALTVLENVGLVEGGLGRLDPALGQRLLETAASLGFDINPDARIDTLSVGQRQRVEIARALMHDARIVILDEPTSVLAPSERSELFSLIRRITSEGAAVVLVTHRLEEALHECDRLTVLRQGAVVGRSDSPRQLTERDLVRMVVGDVRTFAGRSHDKGRVLLEAVGLAGAPPDGYMLRGINLVVHAGEVLGVAGVEGNGQRELAAALVGSWRPEQGVVRLEGTPIEDLPRRELSRSIADVPDDEAVALTSHLSVWQNLAARALMWEQGPRPRMRARCRRRAAELVREFDIRTPSVETPVGRLSGGNRRRVLLARELSKSPRVVVANNATKGLDARSIEQIKEWLARLADGGAAVVYIASELEELLAVSDRIAVLARGRITGTVAAGTASVDEIGQLMLADLETAERKRT